MNANKRIGWVALATFLFDQITKLIVIHTIPFRDDRVVLDGFFKWVHWGNTGAAWSMFHDNNHLLAIVSLVALLVLFFSRNHFDTRGLPGQMAMGLIFGGIVGNLIDRLRIGHVTDFIYFYVRQRSGNELGFPAFNVADTAICTGVGLLFILSIQAERQMQRSGAASS